MASVLIVDRSLPSRISLAGFLAEVGFEVREADDGETALQDVATNGLPDLVFFEWDMGPMNGATFLQHIRDNPASVRLPMLVLTTMTNREAVRQAGMIGVEGYIIKPFVRAEVAVRIAALDLVGHGTSAVQSRCRLLVANQVSS